MKQAAIALTVLMFISAAAFGISVLFENIYNFNSEIAELTTMAEGTVVVYTENFDPDIEYSIEFFDNYEYYDGVEYAVTTFIHEN